jgi:pimeloyl-ACP methyl ester carboxylesterase
MFFFQLPWLPEWMFRGFNGATLGQTFRRQPARADAFKEEDIERYVAAAQQKGAMTCAINYYRAAFRRHPKQLLAIMRRIDQPVLVIWGEQDRFIGRELAQPEPDWVPHARVERLPSASHWVQNDEPEAVNELLVEFLKPVLRDDETRTSG